MKNHLFNIFLCGVLVAMLGVGIGSAKAAKEECTTGTDEQIVACLEARIAETDKKIAEEKAGTAKEKAETAKEKAVIVIVDSITQIITDATKQHRLLTPKEIKQVSALVETIPNGEAKDKTIKILKPFLNGIKK